MYWYLVFSYRARGVYIDQVKNWFKSFPREQILILRSEDFFNNPPEVFQRVLTFLGLPDWKLDKYDIFNFGGYEKMDAYMEEKLSTYFYPHNQELYEYFGTNFNWENL
jgi:hypothetical protein